MEVSINMGWFKRSEFACKCGCGAGDISPVIVMKLEAVRSVYGNPMRIVSGVRCHAHNAEVGGKGDSSHVLGLAVDIAVDSPAQRFRLCELLITEFSRIGVGQTFIHVDIDSSKPQNVIWVY